MYELLTTHQPYEHCDNVKEHVLEGGRPALTHRVNSRVVAVLYTYSYFYFLKYLTAVTNIINLRICFILFNFSILDRHPFGNHFITLRS